MHDENTGSVGLFPFRSKKARIATSSSRTDSKCVSAASMP